jgi:hypothetical protein
MKEGDVVLTPIPQADSRVKYRPAIILREMPLYGALLVCGVSTQPHHYVQEFSEIDPATMQETFESNATFHSSFRQRLKLGVETIRIATACATMHALWRKRCPNHPTWCLARSANRRA